MNGTHLVAGHTLTLLRNGEQYFPALVEAIDQAQHSIYLETYIYAADDTGRLFSVALQNAAKRGVSTRLLLDGFGSAELPESWLDEMRKVGVEVLWFRKEVGRFSWQRYHLRRLHRKLALIDGRTAFVGGINIINDQSPEMTAPRLDYAVKVEGELVQDIDVSMRRLWLLVAWTHFRRPGERKLARQLQRANTTDDVRLVTRDSLRHRHDIERAYLDAIEKAEHEIIIANAYFLPGRRFRKALLKKSLSGVRVILLLQGRIEYRLQHYATLALYDDFLQAGVELYEYQKSHMHAKVAVIDGIWATVGSSNIDPFSLWLAREANLMVNSAGFAKELREDLLMHVTEHSRPILGAGWKKRNLLSRFLMRLSYGFLRILTSILGQAKGRDEL